MKYEIRITENLRDLCMQIEKIKTASNSVSVRQRSEFECQIDLLFAKQDLAEARLRRLSQTTDLKEREELKVGLDCVCREIENAIDSAWAKLGPSWQ